MRKFSIVFAFFFIATSSRVSRAESAGRPRLIVMPFENQSGSRSLDYLSFQFAENLAERFESEPSLTVLNGQFPLLTEAQAKTLHAPEGYLQAACALAKKRGADRVLTGTIKGRAKPPSPSSDGDVSVRIEIRDVADCRADALLGFGDVKGNQLEGVVVSSKRLQEMLADATLLAFARANITLDLATTKALRTVSTTDSYANILMGRAVERYLLPVDVKHHRDALDFAQHAVQVDPKFVEARRFYAFLLESKKGKDGKPQMGKARIHFEAVLADRRTDVRSLIRLGHIEFVAGRPDTAKTYLTQALAARPDDAEPRFWLGETLLKLDDVPGATTAFETVRALEPDGLRARRRLAELYAAREDHLAAAEELKVIVAAEPDNIDATFEEAACLRQGNKDDEALAVYDAAAARFPEEKRFDRFAKYIREPVEPDGPAVGEALITTIVRGHRVTVLVEAWRASFQRAANDAVLDLTLNRKEACSQDRGAASVIAARESREQFLAKRDLLKTAATHISVARKNGEWAFLTSDLRALATRVLDDEKASEVDVRETGAQLDGPIMRLVRANACDLSSLTATPSEVISARNALRQVAMPKAEVPRYMLAITPDVPAMAAKDTQLTVDNRQGAVAYGVIVDGELVGTVEPGSTLTKATVSGYHDVCFLGLDKDCAVGTKSGRRVHLHDGLGFRIRPGARSENVIPERE